MRLIFGGRVEGGFVQCCLKYTVVGAGGNWLWVVLAKTT